MPTLNPQNFDLHQGFPSTGNAYIGQRAMTDQKIGYVSTHLESRQQVLDYRRKREHLVVKATQGNHPVSGVLQPGFGLIWSNFLDNEGRMTLSPCVAARNKAYSRFKDKVVGDSSALGVLGAERREAYGMIAKRATGLYRAYRDLRRGNFKKALNHLGVDPKRKHRSKLKSGAHEASALWLEYWFGWKPTVDELYGLVDTMTKDPPSRRFSGSATVDLNLTDSFSSTLLIKASGRYRVRTGATVVLSNPDLFLLNSLGLVNPATIAWELIPFSFVADWFFKFGDVIDSMSDFVGLDFINPYKSYKLENVVRRATYNAPPFYFDIVETESPGYGMFRDQGITSPTVAKPQWLDTFKSQTRAATAVSLLTQALTSK